ncbi:MAG TPA: hypothetical protein VL574_03695 [Stellaceae bacterium]|jgi:hypothetical protein|nr:hypothetical protein [Stellaceae bacterium]
MIRVSLGVGAALVLGAAMWVGSAQPAAAVTMKECSTMYQAAQKNGTLNGMKWTDFRKAKCGSTSSSASPAATTSPTAAPAAKAPTAGTASSHGSAMFPNAVSPKYSKETAGKARMHTCLDQYNANKTAGGSGNGGMKWIEKGGGYYSECNKHLKS